MKENNSGPALLLRCIAGGAAPPRFLCAGLLICGATLSVAQTVSTSASSSPNPFAGSVPTNVVPGVMPLSLQDAIDRGLKQNPGLLLSRADIRSARGQRLAELSRKAAVAGYFPSLSFGADYGTAGAHPYNASQVFDVHGTLSIPIFTGGSVHGDVEQADARMEQSRERLGNLRAQIESDVHTALLNLQSSASQVNGARSNIELADKTPTQSLDRFSAGVTDTVEVVQSREAVAGESLQL
jgi:outer membrane protein TolC